VACGERIAAALAGAVAAGDRVRPLLVRLDRALLRIEQAVADGEAAGLVEADRWCGHVLAVLIPARPRPAPRRAGCSRRGDRTRARRPFAPVRGSRRPNPCRGRSTARGDRRSPRRTARAAMPW